MQIPDKILEIWPEVCFYPYKIGKIFGSCENPGKFGGSPLLFFFFFNLPDVSQKS